MDPAAMAAPKPEGMPLEEIGGKRKRNLCNGAIVAAWRPKKQVARKKFLIELERTCLEDPQELLEPVTTVSGNSENGEVKSASTIVTETLRIFNKNYLNFVQEEEKRVKELETKGSGGRKAKKPESKEKNKKGGSSKRKCSASPKSEVAAECENSMKRGSKRPDLKAITKMINDKTVIYRKKRFGHLPGIDVGYQFFSRASMVVVGLHGHWLNGIDYMGAGYAKDYKDYEMPMATSIVMSGMYEDDKDNSEDVTYTGQGGHDLLGSKHQISDQKMARGNLALKNSWAYGTPVRVVRGHESVNSYCGRVYTYDGLYKVVKWWAEKGVSGYVVFKYKLTRIDGQPALTTKQVHFARAQAPMSISDLRGLVCGDITGGQENFPIPATNEVDELPFPPQGFVYHKSMQVAKNLKLPPTADGCNCRGDCNDPRTCACAKLNGSDFPYVRKDGGRLVEAKAVVFECGPNCGCNLSCVNRTSQQGLKYRLEVFRTPKKGWAVRSWDVIPSGAPVCEYIGVLTTSDEMENASDNNYIFDIDCLQTMKGLDSREQRGGDVSLQSSIADKESDFPEFCIDAGHYGNVARFINHSCVPNLFVQCVLSSHQDIKMARIMLFAADTIPPLQELTYDYGYALDSVVGQDGVVKKLACHCGADECRKRLY